MKPGNLRLPLRRRKLICLVVAALTFVGGLPDVSPAESVSAALVGSWRAESIRRHGVIANVQTVIDITAEGKVTGSGGCNRVSGGMTVSGARISFSPMAATDMACAAEIMDQEHEFLSALDAARLWRIDEQRDKLILVDAHGVTVLRLLRM